jgi:5-methylthioadenosine/S-adenosylhomocysteine deaminase
MSGVLIARGAVMSPDGWLEPGYVLVEDGLISAVGSGEAPKRTASAAEKVIDAHHCAVLPGLLNAHTHLSQTFMRGLAGGRPLLTWLRELIWPLQGVISPHELGLAALLGLVENLRCGTTTVVNHHKVIASPAHTDAVCQAAEQIGLNFTLARSWSDRGTNAEHPDQIVWDLERLFERWSEPKSPVQIANGPIALWRCSEDMLRKTRALAQRNHSFTHFHVSETQDEVEMCLRETGKRPIEWLSVIDVLGPDTQVVHAVWVEPDEIQILVEAGAPVIHCPVSNAVLGSGIAPVAAMLRQGVSLKFGTDGPASNDTQDLWETLKMAVSFARAQTQDPTILPPKDALRIATGGRFLKPGGVADLIVVDLNHPRAVPVQDVDSALALCVNGGDVRDVMLGGQLVLKDRRLLILDESALLDECRVAIRSIRRRAGLN